MPEIEPVPVEIIEAARAGRLVVFIGAGVSRLAGAPSWRGFANQLLEHLYENGAIDHYEKSNLALLDPKKLLTICDIIQAEKKDIPKPDYPAFIEGQAQPAKWQPIYKSLYRFNTIFVTTNYDQFLDKIAKGILTPPPGPEAPKTPEQSGTSTPEPKSFYLGKDLLESKLENGNVLHLHGSLEAVDSMIVTVSDYLEHYKPGSNAQQFLEKLFQGSYRVLFVGYGLEELEILEFLVRGAAPPGAELQHFMLYPFLEEEARILDHHKRYYRELGVRLIPYSISKKGHESLIPILDKWAEQIGPVAKPMEFLERRAQLDAVI